MKVQIRMTSETKDEALHMNHSDRFAPNCIQSHKKKEKACKYDEKTRIITKKKDNISRPKENIFFWGGKRIHEQGVINCSLRA